MGFPVYRQYLGVAPDTTNGTLSASAASGTTSLSISNAVGAPSFGSTPSVTIIDGPLTETVTWSSGTISSGTGTITVGTLANSHSANAYVVFQASLGGATAWIPVTKMDYSDAYVQLLDQGFRGSNVKNYGSQQGMRTGDLSVDGDLFADSFGYLLSSMFGSYDYAATSGGNPTTYTFSPKNGTTGQPTPYLFYVYNPGGGASAQTAGNTRVFAKAVISDLSLKFDPGALSNYSATIKSFASGIVSNGTPSFSSFTPVPARVATVSVGGTSTVKCEAAEYSIKREEFGEIATLQGIQDPLAIWSGPLSVTGKATLVMDDDTYLNGYLNPSNANYQTSFKLTANQGTTTAANGVTVQTTKTNYETVKVLSSGKGFVQLEVPFTALANSTDASTAGGGLSPIKVTLSTGTTTGSTQY